MRAWQVTGAGEPADVLHLVEVDLPEPGPGQARIRVTAAGIGLPDVFMCRGTYPLTPPLPFTPGQEATGVVTAVGDGVDLQSASDHGRDRLLRGERFVRRGVPGAGGVQPSPFPTGSPTPRRPGSGSRTSPGGSGWWTAVGSPPANGWRCSGAPGGAGLAAVQLGRALGARVIAVVSDEERAAFCRSLGAEATINHRDGPLAPALRELTDGRGVDLIYDPVGGRSAEEAAGALARNGRLLSVGFASGSGRAWPPSSWS